MNFQPPDPQEPPDEEREPNTIVTSLEDGKYVIHNCADRLTVYRNGEPTVWRAADLVGDKFVGALVNRIEELEQAAHPIARKLVVGAIACHAVYMAPAHDDPVLLNITGLAFNAQAALRDLLAAMYGVSGLETLDTLCCEIVERGGNMTQEDLARMRSLVEY